MRNLRDHGRSNTQLAALFFAPIGLIGGLGIVLILSLLKASALRLDRSQQDAELRLARSVVTTMVAAPKKSAADYANWDDMYDQFAARPDAQWARETQANAATPSRPDDAPQARRRPVAAVR